MQPVTWLVIGTGAALGAIARHELNGFVTRTALGRHFPAGIFVINVLGSALIGLLGGALAVGRINLSEHTRTFLAVGILGGFTTFSAFSLDTLALFRSRHYGLALWNAAGQVVLGFLAAWAGFRIGASGSLPDGR
jgi:CrcB protein